MKTTTEFDADRQRAFFDDVIHNPDKYPDNFIALPFDFEDIQKALTRERMRLYRTVKEQGPMESLHGLADALGRNYSSVSRDVTFLEGIGFLTVEKVGRQKRIAWSGRVIVIG